MLIDFRTYEPPVIEADLCIVGAGPAGISLAREFLDTGYEVCLLEGGGADFEKETQPLHQGRNVGDEYYPLDEAQLRFFGGSRHVWGGQCAPLDAIDFQKRDWVPYSGWPFSRNELMPYYRRAQKALGLGPFVYGKRLWESLDVEPPEFEPDRIGWSFCRFDEMRSRLSIDHCTDITTAENIRVILHANVSNIQVNEASTSVEYLDVASPGGHRARARARFFVLACGGIETPRLLLASRGVERNGVGNQNDLVGRFFMEHPHASAGVVTTNRPFELWDLFRKRFRARRSPIAPVLRAGEELQRERRALNTAVSLTLKRSPGKQLSLSRTICRRAKARLHPNSTGRRAWHVYQSADALLHRYLRPAIRRTQARRGSRELRLMLRGEQAPNPASRIVLGTERDRLGMPTARLDWKQSPLDTHSAFVLIEALRREFQRLGLGSIEVAPWIEQEAVPWPIDSTVSNPAIVGYHHMGTTRMDVDARRGVVDAAGRVHGYRNLFVAGSSVFPTSGWATPTLTIFALSVRAADHLKTELARRDPVTVVTSDSGQQPPSAPRAS